MSSPSSESPGDKITIHLGELHENIKSKIYEEAVKFTNIIRIVKENMPVDCILTAERKDFRAHKVILQAVSTYLKVIIYDFAFLWL